jgi:hypothetical protein
MIKSITAGLCVLAVTGTFAFAQSSQGQAGTTGPIAQQTQSNPMDANARMMGKKKMMMKRKMMMMKKKKMMMKRRGMM